MRTMGMKKGKKRRRREKEEERAFKLGAGKALL